MLYGFFFLFLNHSSVNGVSINGVAHTHWKHLANTTYVVMFASTGLVQVCQFQSKYSTEPFQRELSIKKKKRNHGHDQRAGTVTFCATVAWRNTFISREGFGQIQYNFFQCDSQ